MPSTSAGVVQRSDAQSGSVEDRMKHLTSVVQELAKLVTTGVAASSAQPQEGAAQGAPAASSSDALDPYKLKGHQIPTLKFVRALQLMQSQGLHQTPFPVPPAGLHPQIMKISQNVGCVVARSTTKRTVPNLQPTSVARRIVLREVVQAVAGILAIMAQMGARTVTLQPVRLLLRKPLQKLRKRRFALSLSDLTFP